MPFQKTLGFFAFSVVTFAGSMSIGARLLADDFDSARERAVANVRRFESNVFRRQIDPQWQPDGRWMWYRVTTGRDKHEFVRVDLESGKREPAMDHARLAESLAKATGREVKALSLNISRLVISPDGATIEFRFGAKGYRCSLNDYALEEIAAGASAPSELLTRARRSVSGGEETHVRFVNKLEQRVTCFWRGTDGSATRYATIEPGAAHEQHTFAGHIWEIRDADGNELLRVAAVEGDVEFTIDAAALDAFKNLPSDGGRSAPRDAMRGPRRERRSDEGPRPQVFVKENNLWLHSETEGDVRLTDCGTTEAPIRGDVAWSHDRKRLIARQTTVVEERKIQILEAAVPVATVHELNYNKPGDPLPQTTLHLIDVESRKQTPISDELMKPQWSLGDVRWSADDSQVTCLFNQRGHGRLSVLAIDPQSGEVRRLIDETSPTFVDYAHKNFLHFDDARSEVLWMSERSGWNHLHRFDSRTGAALGMVTSGSWVVRSVEQVDDEARELLMVISGYHEGQDPYYRHLARVRFDGSEFKVLTDGDGDHRWQFSPDRKWFIDTWSRVDLPPLSVLRRSVDGSLVCELERADCAELIAAGWQLPERFSAKGRDGTTDIYGVIVRPSHFDPMKKYPVIEQIYAGPQSAFVPKSFGVLGGLTEIAEHGFIVVQIDGMGTSNRSKAFHDVCYKNIRDAGFPDRKLWLKAAAEKHPELDLNRVGIYGGSAGGQNAMRALLDHHDLYKVAVADCGCHDNRLDKIWWNELWMSWPVDESYARSSNLEDAAKLQGKLLLVVGEVDRNVDPVSTYATAAALVRAGKEFELLIMPGAGHGAAESPYGKKRRAKFLYENLIGTP